MVHHASKDPYFLSGQVDGQENKKLADRDWRLTNKGSLGSYTLRREKSILTLMIIFRVKINVAIYIEPRNGVKIFKK